MTTYYTRKIEKQITAKLFKGRAIILYGPRQTGKTTLIKHCLSSLDKKVLNLNCDNADIRETLSIQNETALRQLVGKNEIIFIDEAQRVQNIGLVIKILVDNFKNIQVIASGSSAIELANNINEPLTGRKHSFQLFPLSIAEYFDNQYDPIEFQRLLPSLLVYGSYPEVLLQKENTDKKDLIRELASDALFKDIYTFQKIKNPSILSTLLKALALQVGSEVSNNELAQTVGVDKKTIESYIDLLEKNFIVFRLPSFAKDIRNELKKSKKIYFYDLGIRNAIINNFNSLENRNDIGSLWENYCLIERVKYQQYHPLPSNNYFWRTYDGAEIDWIEEREGELHAYEIKWNKHKSTKCPTSWGKAYPNSTWQIVNPQNINILFE